MLTIMQESAWDYPRPPRLERTDRHLVVVLAGVTIADTTRAWRVLETSHRRRGRSVQGRAGELELVTR
jgi:uncharacterized protein (DUF427 family)